MQHAEIIAITAAITACNLDQYVCVFATLTSNHIWHADSLTLSKKGKVPPYSLLSVGPGADPGVQAVSPQVTKPSPPVVDCQYFPPGLRLPSQPVPNYTAW